MNTAVMAFETSRNGRETAQTSALAPSADAANEYLLHGSGPNAATGVLLIHGLTGTPNEMRLLAKGLHRVGFTVLAVQLAGHCGTQDDLVATRWQDWQASVQRGANQLEQVTGRPVVACGLSMGAVLALALAEDRPQQVAGVIALSTTFHYDGWSIPFYTRLSFLLPLFRTLGIGRHSVFMEQPPYGIKDAALRERVVAQMHSGDSAAAGLPGNPWWSVIEMRALAAYVRKHLGRVRSPCLVIHARHDDIASTENAQTIVRGVRHAPVELVLLEDSYHMITIDRERRTVLACASAFVERLASKGTV
jgi:carboxylesterase